MRRFDPVRGLLPCGIVSEPSLAGLAADYPSRADTTVGFQSPISPESEIEIPIIGTIHLMYHSGISPEGCVISHVLPCGSSHTTRRISRFPAGCDPNFASGHPPRYRNLSFHQHDGIRAPRGNDHTRIVNISRPCIRPRARESPCGVSRRRVSHTRDGQHRYVCPAYVFQYTMHVSTVPCSTAELRRNIGFQGVSKTET